MIQVAFFARGIVKGTCRFGPRIVMGDWSHSEKRTKYFILGTMVVNEEEILVENWGKIYPLARCPQREFYRKLDCGEHIQADPYYAESMKRLNVAEFEAWLRVKLELWENFKQDPKEFTPIAVRYSKTHFMVQDGAHRLSLRSLSGIDNHELGIGFWNCIQMQ